MIFAGFNLVQCRTSEVSCDFSMKTLLFMLHVYPTTDECFQVCCNILENNEYGGVKIMAEPQQICQNTITGPSVKV